MTGILNIGISKAKNKTEIKRIKLLNLTAGIALFHAVFFLLFDYLTDNSSTEKLTALFLEVLIFGFVLLVQNKGYFKIARYAFIIVVYLLLFYHCNMAFKGYYGEYQYFVVPLFSLFLFDKYYIHYSLLLLSILAFYLPNMIWNIYPEQYFGYLNALLLFIGIFLIVDFFKRNSVKNEKALEQQLNENEKLHKDLDQKHKELQSLHEFQNQFFVNISHEMNTPISIIKGHLFETSKKDVDFNVTKFNLQLDNLQNLTQNIFDIAKLNEGSLSLNPKVVAINDVLQNVYYQFETIFEETKVGLELELLDTNDYILVDSIYFERAIGNLISNSLKYAVATKNKVTLKTCFDNGKLAIHIIDDCLGVHPDELHLIFERFYRSKTNNQHVQGSGIGLSFVKEIVELHKGAIQALNNEKGGLSVIITVPITASVNNEVERGFTNNKTLIVENKRILVVDDSSDMRAYIARVLEGYSIVFAEDGQEAIELIAKESFDCIITDYMMPIINGKELFVKLKEDKIKIPLIMITGSNDINLKLELLELGVDDYIKKPFIEEELLIRLKNCLINAENRNSEANNNLEAQFEQNDKIVQCKTLIINNISDVYYGVAQLSEDMQISERTLYRLLKKATGLSPNNFVREIKLNEVRKKLNLDTKMTLNELAISVGLKNGSYLKKLYLERFGNEIKK